MLGLRGEAAVAALADDLLGRGVLGVSWYVNDGVADVARGELARTWGDPTLRMALGERTFELAPLAFFQTNTAATEVLYATVGEALGRGHRVLLDLYCGTGSIGITLGAVAIGSLLGSVADLADDEVIQEFLHQLGGSAGTIEDIFVATEVRFVAVAVAAAGVALLLRLVGAERGGLGEVVLTTPVSRTRWYAAHVAVSLVLVTALMALFGLVLGVVGSAVTPLAPSVGAAAGAALSTVPAIWVVVGVAALLCGALPRVAPLVWGVLLVAFVVGELGTTMNLPSWVIDASPFAHLSQLPGGEFERVPAVWLTLIAAALIVAGWAAYRRRDAV